MPWMRRRQERRRARAKTPNQTLTQPHPSVISATIGKARKQTHEGKVQNGVTDRADSCLRFYKAPTVIASEATDLSAMNGPETAQKFLASLGMAASSDKNFKL